MFGLKMFKPNMQIIFFSIIPQSEIVEEESSVAAAEEESETESAEETTEEQQVSEEKTEEATEETTEPESSVEDTEEPSSEEMQEGTYENYKYVISEKQVTLTKYTGTETDVVIPTQVEGYDVTAIGDSCFKDSKTIQTVSIPETVVSIGERAFQGCSALVTVQLPTKLETLKKYAFYSCGHYGCGKSEAYVTATKAGIVNELNYHVTQSWLVDSKVTYILDKLTYKNGTVTGAKVTLYDEGIKISPKEYTLSVAQANEQTLCMTIMATNKNYYGGRYVNLPLELQSVKDKSISVTLNEKVFYYTGEEICPEIKVATKIGEDITDKVTITYANNVSVGKGKIIITGNLQEGYCGEKTVNFVILPKWMKWMF